jgi:hypothetical protein
MTRTRGFAVIDAKGNILVRTITDSVRGAKVNWLGTIGGVLVPNTWSDKMIADAFERMRGEVDVVEVEIKVRKHG